MVFRNCSPMPLAKLAVKLESGRVDKLLSVILARNSGDLNDTLS